MRLIKDFADTYIVHVMFAVLWMIILIVMLVAHVCVGGLQVWPFMEPKLKWLSP